MEFTKTRVGWWGSLAIKCVLSCAVIWASLVLFDLVRLWCAVHPAPKRAGIESTASYGVNHQPEDLAQNNGILWPQCFGSAGSSVEKITINGVQMISQAWETTAPAKVPW